MPAAYGGLVATLLQRGPLQGTEDSSGTQRVLCIQMPLNDVVSLNAAEN